MSTISAGINSLTSASLVDFYQRLWRNPDLAEKHQLKIARWLTFSYGAIVIVLAFLVHRLGTLLRSDQQGHRADRWPARRPVPAGNSDEARHRSRRVARMARRIGGDALGLLRHHHFLPLVRDDRVFRHDGDRIYLKPLRTSAKPGAVVWADMGAKPLRLANLRLVPTTMRSKQSDVSIRSLRRGGLAIALALVAINVVTLGFAAAAAGWERLAPPADRQWRLHLSRVWPRNLGRRRHHVGRRYQKWLNPIWV